MSTWTSHRTMTSQILVQNAFCVTNLTTVLKQNHSILLAQCSGWCLVINEFSKKKKGFIDGTTQKILSNNFRTIEIVMRLNSLIRILNSLDMCFSIKEVSVHCVSNALRDAFYFLSSESLKCIFACWLQAYLFSQLHLSMTRGRCNRLL